MTEITYEHDDDATAKALTAPPSPAAPPSPDAPIASGSPKTPIASPAATAPPVVAGEPWAPDATVVAVAVSAGNLATLCFGGAASSARLDRPTLACARGAMAALYGDDVAHGPLYALKHDGALVELLGDGDVARAMNSFEPVKIVALPREADAKAERRPAAGPEPVPSRGPPRWTEWFAGPPPPPRCRGDEFPKVREWIRWAAGRPTVEDRLRARGWWP